MLETIKGCLAVTCVVSNCTAAIFMAIILYLTMNGYEHSSMPKMASFVFAVFIFDAGIVMGDLFNKTK